MLTERGVGGASWGILLNLAQCDPNSLILATDPSFSIMCLTSLRIWADDDPNTRLTHLRPSLLLMGGGSHSVEKMEH